METVHFETLSVLLLNEVQRQVRQLRDQLDALRRQQGRIDALEQRLNLLAASDANADRASALRSDKRSTFNSMARRVSANLRRAS